MTMLSSLRSNGEKQCLVYEGGTTKALFEAYISEQLCPTLKAGDIVIMDNLSARKSSRITKSIEERGANILYLPPYSPDLNPIEKITPLDAKNWFKSCGYYS